MGTRRCLGLRSVVAVATILLTVVALAPSVSAEVIPGGPAPGAQANPPTSTVELVGTSSGQSVTGFNSTLTDAQRLNGYPTTVPQAGWSAHNVGFAGLIQMRVTAGPGTGATFLTYCIDILTPTNIGFDYNRGELNEANIPNVGYIAQLLQSYLRRRRVNRRTCPQTRGPPQCKPRSGSSVTATSCRRAHRLRGCRHHRQPRHSARSADGAASADRDRDRSHERPGEHHSSALSL